MMKWLLLAVVVVAVLWWLGRGRRSGHGDDSGAAATRSNRNAAGSAHAQGGTTNTPEPMVACAHCGVWLPKADAVGEVGSASPETRLYCSEAHRRAGPGRE